MIIRSLKQKQEASVSSPQVHRMANQMRRYFAPRSMLPPPGSVRGATGNRNVAITAANAANAAPTDTAVLQFVNGVALWRFATKFNNPPLSTANAIGFDGGSPANPQEIMTKGPGTNEAVIFLSSDATDSRLITVHALGNPD